MTVVLAEEGSSDKPNFRPFWELTNSVLRNVPIWARLKFNSMVQDLQSLIDGTEPVIRMTVMHNEKLGYRVVLTFVYYDGYSWMDDKINLIITK